ncbi:MAG: glycosyltransferase family 4 protein [Cellulosilyticaceae bacterium]
MNIGIFTDTYSPQINGVVSSIVTLEKQLQAQGHNVYIFTVSHPKAEPAPGHVYRLPSMPFVFLKDHRVGLLYSTKIVRQIKKLKLDLILSQTEFSLGFFAKLTSKKLHIPIIHTYHTMYEEYMHYVSKGVELSPELARKYSKKFCNSVNGVVAPTEKTKNLLEGYGVKTPIRVIPTGIDFSPFNPDLYSESEITALKEQFGIPTDAPIILFVGRVAKEKSIDVLINALGLLTQHIPHAHLVIVGDGPEKSALQNQAHTLGVQNNITFTGLQPWATIGKFYQLGDVFVSASVTETQGLTFIEAMAAKLPVLAKYDDSIKDVVINDYNGKLFETYEELAKILENILGDTESLQTFSQNAITSVAPLSAEIFGENALAFYDEIITSFEHAATEAKKLKNKKPKKTKSRSKDL